MSFMTRIKRPHLFNVFQVQMRTPDASEAQPAEDFLVVTDTLQEAINFAINKFPELDITLIQRTNEQVFYGVE